MEYISSWQIYTGSLHKSLEALVKMGKIKTSDTVWYGPSGDAVVGYIDDEEYLDYVDEGTVQDILAE